MSVHWRIMHVHITVKTIKVAIGVIVSLDIIWTMMVILALVSTSVDNFLS